MISGEAASGASGGGFYQRLETAGREFTFMMKSTIRVADKRLAKMSEQQKKTNKERERARVLKADHIARLRALRLAKEASDRAAAPPPKRARAAKASSGA